MARGTGPVSPLFVRRSHARRSCLLRVEELEPRTVPAAFDPAQIRNAYAFDEITIGDGSLPGTGQTIAIVAAYDNPTIAADLATFNAAFGLPDAPSFRKVSQTGSATDMPRVDAAWAAEIALDVQWAHAIAPGADILLVQANSSNLSDMLTAVDYARSQPGVSVVSMSWGGAEFAAQEFFDSYFTTPEGHTGVTFVAASGDSGAGPSWPAVSPNVLSVGGTTLTLTSTGDIAAETAWAGSGGGVSEYTPRPDYQASATGRGLTNRATPDVAYDANPRTGFPVYDSQNGGWYIVGGTSAGAPQWAALVAIANQARELAGKAPLDGPSQTLHALYEAAEMSHSTFFNDVTAGSNGFRTTEGFDLVTGLGTPVADQLVSALAAWNGTGSSGGFGPFAPQSTTPSASTRTTRNVSPTPPATVRVPAPVAFAAPVANPVLAPVNAPMPTLTPAPVFTSSSQPSAGQSMAVTPLMASTTAFNSSIPMSASASGGSAADGAGDSSGFWEWLFGSPKAEGAAEESDEGAEETTGEATDGDGAEGTGAEAAVAAVAGGE